MLPFNKPPRTQILRINMIFFCSSKHIPPTIIFLFYIRLLFEERGLKLRGLSYKQGHDGRDERQLEHVNQK